MNSSYPVFDHVFAGALSLFSQDRWAGQPNVTKKPEVEIENERAIGDLVDHMLIDDKIDDLLNHPERVIGALDEPGALPLVPDEPGALPLGPDAPGALPLVPVDEPDGSDEESSYSSESVLRKRKSELHLQIQAGLRATTAITSCQTIEDARKKAKKAHNALSDAMTTLDML